MRIQPEEGAPQTRRVPSVASCLKELAQKRGAWCLLDPRDDLNPRSNPPVPHQIPLGSRCPRLLVPGSENEPCDARLENRAGAHRARFEGDDERVAVETPRSCGLGCLSQGEDFGMGGWIGGGFPAIVTSTDDPTNRIDDNRTDGNVPIGKGEPGLG